MVLVGFAVAIEAPGQMTRVQVVSSHGCEMLLMRIWYSGWNRRVIVLMGVAAMNIIP
jgi:hypothetical protein